jgi:hypothetical protein
MTGPLQRLANAACVGQARRAFFPPVPLAPEGSPTGFHSADVAETVIAADKSLNIKAFGLNRCALYSLAISLQRGNA